MSERLPLDTKWLVLAKEQVTGAGVSKNELIA